MSRKQDKQRSGRTCRDCRRPSGARAVCSACSPRRGTRVHRDKYAQEMTP